MSHARRTRAGRGNKSSWVRHPQRFGVKHTIPYILGVFGFDNIQGALRQERREGAKIKDRDKRSQHSRAAQCTLGVGSSETRRPDPDLTPKAAYRDQHRRAVVGLDWINTYAHAYLLSSHRARDSQRLPLLRAEALEVSQQEAPSVPKLVREEPNSP